MDKESLEKFEDDLREFYEHLESMKLLHFRLKKIWEREREREMLLGVEAEVTNFENR